VGNAGSSAYTSKGVGTIRTGKQTGHNLLTHFQSILISRTRRDNEPRTGRTTFGEERTLHQQFVDHGFDDEVIHRSRRPNMRSRFANAATRSGIAEPYLRRRAEREYRYEPDAGEWEMLDPVSPQYEVFPHPTALSPPPLRTEESLNPSTLFNWIESDLSVGPIHRAAAETGDDPSTTVATDSRADSSAVDDVLASDAHTEPPATLDRASPAPATAARSRSSSPDEASRAWLAEYEALVPASGSSGTFSLGRRRRDDDTGPSTRRRLRHTGEGRDTRRDAVIFSPGPESWLDNVISRDRRGFRLDPFSLTGASVTSNVGSASRSGSTADDATIGAEDETIVIGDETASTHTLDSSLRENVAHEAGNTLSRTMSLSAVGRGDRPVAPLPRRRTSMLTGWE
jgi:hypothetical protein